MANEGQQYDVVCRFRDEDRGGYTQDIFRVSALTGDEAADAARKQAEGKKYREISVHEITPINELTAARSDLPVVLGANPDLRGVPQHTPPAETYGVGPTATGPAIPADPRNEKLDRDNVSARGQLGKDVPEEARPMDALKDATRDLAHAEAQAAQDVRREVGDEEAAGVSPKERAENEAQTAAQRAGRVATASRGDEPAKPREAKPKK